jgi:hypothetical protein
MDYSRLTLVLLVVDWRFCWSLEKRGVAGDGSGAGRRKAPRAAVDWRSAAWPATGLVPAAEKLHARPSMEKRGVAGDGPGAGRRKAARAAVDGL